MKRKFFNNKVIRPLIWGVFLGAFATVAPSPGGIVSPANAQTTVLTQAQLDAQKIWDAYYARMETANQQSVSVVPSGTSWVIKYNLAEKYAFELISVQMGSYVNGVLRWRYTDRLMLNVNGDGAQRVYTKPKAGTYIRFVLGNTIIYKQKFV